VGPAGWLGGCCWLAGWALAGWLAAGWLARRWLAGWLAGSTIQLNHAWMDAIAYMYFAVTWMHM